MSLTRRSCGGVANSLLSIAPSVGGQTLDQIHLPSPVPGADRHAVRHDESCRTAPSPRPGLFLTAVKALPRKSPQPPESAKIFQNLSAALLQPPTRPGAIAQARRADKK